MATRKQSRYKFYRENHFLPFEAQLFKNINVYSRRKDGQIHRNGFLDDMVRDRKYAYEGLLKEAKLNRWNKKRFENELTDYVMSEYRNRGWLIRNPRLRIDMINQPDPYRMLKHFRSAWLEKIKAHGKDWGDTDTDLPDRKHTWTYDQATGKIRRTDKLQLSKQRKEMRAKKQYSRIMEKQLRHPLSDNPYSKR